MKTVITCCRDCQRTVEEEDGKLYLNDPLLEFTIRIRSIDEHGFVNGLWSLSGKASEKLERLLYA